MPVIRLPPSLSPLRHRDFGIYWVGQLFAVVGRQFETTATTWLLYELTDSPLALGAAGLGRGGAVIGLTLLAGSLIDRIGSRTLLYWAQGIYSALSLTLAFLAWSGLVQPWHLVLTATINGIVLAFDAPARQTMYAWLVPRADLARAVPLNSSVRHLGLVAGPAVAGIIISVFGVVPIYLANGVTFGALIVSLLMIRAREVRQPRTGSIWRHTVEGLNYVTRTPILAGLMLALMLFSTFSHSTALMTIFARDVLGTGAAGLGLLSSATGAGALLGSVLTVTFSAYVRRQGLLLLVAGVAYSLVLAAFSLSAWLPLSFALGLGLGMGQAVWSAMANTVVQLASPDQMRGRVISFHVLVTRGFDAFSAVQLGFLVSVLGPTVAVIVGAGVMGTAMVAIGATIPAVRAFRVGDASQRGMRAPPNAR